MIQSEFSFVLTEYYTMPQKSHNPSVSSSLKRRILGITIFGLIIVGLSALPKSVQAANLSSTPLPYTGSYGTYTDYFRGDNVFVFYNAIDATTKADSAGTYNTGNFDTVSNLGHVGTFFLNATTYAQVRNTGTQQEVGICTDNTYTNCTMYNTGNNSGGVDYVNLYGADFYSTQDVSDYFGGAGYVATGGTPTCTETCFFNMIPANGSTVALAPTTTISFGIIVKPEDFSLGSKVHVRVWSSYIQQLACVYCAISDNHGGLDVLNFDVPLLTDGVTNYSTTTTLTSLGRYKYDLVYSKERFLFFGKTFGTKTIKESHTTFIYSERNSLDIAHDFQQERIKALTSGVGTTTISFTNACSPFSSDFNMGDCLLTTIVPSGQEMDDNITILKGIAPWGWAFRFYDIASGNGTTTATSSMPTISYTTASTSIFGVIDIELDPFSPLLQPDNIVNAVSDRDDPKTIWQILEPVVYLIVYLMLGLKILQDITGIEFEPTEAQSLGADIYTDIARDKVYHQRQGYYKQIHKITKRK